MKCTSKFNCLAKIPVLEKYQNNLEILKFRDLIAQCRLLGQLCYSYNHYTDFGLHFQKLYF